MSAFDERMKLTYEENEPNVFEVYTNYGTEKELIIVLNHPDRQASEEIAKHICQIPNLVTALHLWNKLQKHDRLTINESVKIQSDLTIVMNNAHKELYGE